MKNEIIKNLFIYSWPLIFLGLLTSVFSWIDSFIIGFFKDATSVGIYNVAVPIAMFLIIVPSLFISLFFPMVTKEFAKKDIALVKEISKQVGKWIFILNLPIIILLFLFPGAIVNLLFGPDYVLKSVETSIRFLSLGLFFYSISMISENLLSMIGKSKQILINLSISSILNVLLNIL
jgi:O-antigen/teichoic acid export membrane protein